MQAYLIFVISFSQAAFSNSKLYTRKLPKNTPKHSKMFFVCSIWKILHLPEYFYTDTAHGAQLSGMDAGDEGENNGVSDAGEISLRLEKQTFTVSVE